MKNKLVSLAFLFLINSLSSEPNLDIERSEKEILKSFKGKKTFKIDEVLILYRHKSNAHLQANLAREERTLETKQYEQTNNYSLIAANRTGIRKRLPNGENQDIFSLSLEGTYTPFKEYSDKLDIALRKAEIPFVYAQRMDQLLSVQESMISNYAQWMMANKNRKFREKYLVELNKTLRLYKKAKKYTLSNKDNIRFLEKGILRVKASIKEDQTEMYNRLGLILRSGDIGFPDGMALEPYDFDFNTFDIREIDNWVEFGTKNGFPSLLWNARDSFNRFHSILKNPRFSLIPQLTFYGKLSKDGDIDDIPSLDTAELEAGIDLEFDILNGDRTNLIFDRSIQLRKKAGILIHKINTLKKQYVKHLYRSARDTWESLENVKNNQINQKKDFRRIFRETRGNIRTWSEVSSMANDMELIQISVHKLEARFLQLYLTFKYLILKN